MVRRIITLGDYEDLIAVSPVFMLMGGVIAGYLAPYVLGKIDDLEIRQIIKKNRQSSNTLPRRWKCKCNAILVEHPCAACDVLNDADVQSYCTDCNCRL